MKLAVIGNIGVGKTTLVTSLATRLSIPTFSEWADRPLFDLFSQNRKTWGLTFHFHMLHERLANHLLCEVSGGVLDRSIWETRIFAKVLFDSGDMTKQDFDLFGRRFDQISKLADSKNITYIHLKCAPEMCLSRIENRGRLYERNIDLKYLNALNNEYIQMHHFFCSKNLIEIETTTLDARATLEATLSKLDVDKSRY